MDYLVTVADNNIVEELEDFSTSISKGGWTQDILVFSPQDNPIESIPSNCRKVVLDPYWTNTHRKNRDNISAALKPEIFLSDLFEEGDRILYMDSADIIVLCNCQEIFDQLDSSSILAAKADKKKEDKSYHSKFRKDIVKEFKLNPEIMKEVPTVNSGVILGRKCEKLNKAMSLWKDMVEFSGFHMKLAKGLIGDQVSFNYVFNSLKKEELIEFLPEEYNYNSAKRVNKLKIRSGQVYKPGENGSLIKVVHGSGTKKEMHKKFRELIK